MHMRFIWKYVCCFLVNLLQGVTETALGREKIIFPSLQLQMTADSVNQAALCEIMRFLLCLYYCYSYSVLAAEHILTDIQLGTRRGVASARDQIMELS